MTKLFDLLDKFGRKDFPDLEAAAKAVSLDHLVTPGRQPAALAQKTQNKLLEQRNTDFCNFQKSLGPAVERGNKNSCVDKHEFDDTDRSLGQWQAGNAPKAARPLTRPYKAGSGLPPAVSSAPGGKPAVSLSQAKVNHGASSTRAAQPYYVPTLRPAIDKGKQQRTADRFVRGQAGRRGTTVGDAGIVFGPTGTPYPGSSYLDRAATANQSSNLASSTPPVLDAPSEIKPKVVGTAGVNRADSGQVAPQGDTTGNVLALLGIAAVITGIMFALQYVISTVAFIFNIQNLLVTCNNIAASFSALFNTIGSLLGLGEDISKPLDDTINGLLNSVFGQEKVAYVKYQWARVSSAFSAAGNVLNSLRGVSNTLGNAIETGANSAGRIGNGLKAAGFLDQTMAAFDEKVSIKTQSSKLLKVDQSLQIASGASAGLSQAATDIKSGREELAAIEKQYEEQQAKSKENTGNAEKDYKGDSPSIPNFKPGDY
jgi:hypothetical protein